MGATVGREADSLAFLEALEAAPYRFDFYQTLRVLECLFDEQPRWGTALRPADEPVRLGQAADLSFAPAPLASFERPPGTTPRLHVHLAGLLGANGPLPLHMTEYTRERLRNADDPTLSRFLDIFHHRFLALLYRAWAQAQPHVSRDRPGADRFVAFVGAFLGIAPDSLHGLDGVPDAAKLFHVGSLARQVRNADGLAAILTQFFGVAVVVEEFVGHWLHLEERDRTSAGVFGATLGVQTVLGSRVWDRQHKFRVRLGPLPLAQYESFLPGQARLDELVDWVRLYLCLELTWDVRLVLDRREVPPLRLGSGARLGWTSWLGRRESADDAGDLCLNAGDLCQRELRTPGAGRRAPDTGRRTHGAVAV
jgi:type VI secretion system protein ImpH